MKNTLAKLELVIFFFTVPNGAQYLQANGLDCL